jgi:biopolymer transport protein ExbB/TolQ
MSVENRSAASLAQVPLAWHRKDIEQRLGFSGGRFTRPNGWLAFLMALLATAAFYAALIPLTGTWWAQLFTERGPTQYATVLFTFWCLAILLLKWRKLAFQRKALDYIVVPESHDFVLAPATTEQVFQKIYATVDDPKQFLLFNRILIALSNLQNLGRVGDVDDILRSQAAQDESAMETSYALVYGFVWAIPVLGFIGTVLGLSQAIGAFSEILKEAKDFNAVSEGLRAVTGGLATAFDTTLVALVAALGIYLLFTLVKKSEEEFLDRCTEYCIRHIVDRLRMLPFEPDQKTD